LQEEHPNEIRVDKRSTQPTKLKEPVERVRWEKTLGFPECKANLVFPEAMQGKLARGAPKGKPSKQEEHPTNKTEEPATKPTSGKKLGVSQRQHKHGVSLRHNKAS